MDYKEKYNKLVEAIKVLQKTNPSDEGIQNWVNDNVPELAESEDEKVKRILHSISSKMSFHLRDIFTEEEFQCFDAWAIAWLENIPYTIDHEKREGFHLGYKAALEKQGTSYTKRDVDDAYVEGMAFAKEELEKQKPTWSEEDKDYFDAIIAKLEVTQDDAALTDNQMEFLKSLKQRIGG